MQKQLKSYVFRCRRIELHHAPTMHMKGDVTAMTANGSVGPEPIT